MSAKSQAKRFRKKKPAGAGPPPHVHKLIIQLQLDRKDAGGVLQESSVSDPFQVCEAEFGKSLWQIMNDRGLRPANQQAEKKTA